MSDFRPLPFLGNPHLQTIVASWLPAPELPRGSTERRVRLEDGDQLVLHESVPSRWRPGDRVAVLLHGLGGSHRSGHTVRMAGALFRGGVRVLRMDLRGSGRGIGLALRPYHGGCSDDVRTALAAVARWCPESPITLIGVSLGGNIALKLAGEAAKQPVLGLERVAALAPPVDLVRCSELLGERRNRLYEAHFLRQLVAQAQRRQWLLCQKPITFPRALTMRIFDDVYTARQWGFEGALDYYRRASALPLLAEIAVPTLILTARDDPFIAIEPFDSSAVPGHVEVRILPRGGHIGFLGWDGAGGVHWAEHRITQWVLRAALPAQARPVIEASDLRI